MSFEIFFHWENPFAWLEVFHERLDGLSWSTQWCPILRPLQFWSMLGGLTKFHPLFCRDVYYRLIWKGKDMSNFLTLLVINMNYVAGFKKKRWVLQLSMFSITPYFTNCKLPPTKSQQHSLVTWYVLSHWSWNCTANLAVNYNHQQSTELSSEDLGMCFFRHTLIT